MGGFIDLTDTQFGHLRVLYRDGVAEGRHDARWVCLCFCGTIARINSRYLRLGETRSCGCLTKQWSAEKRTIHGHSKPHTRTYAAWSMAKSRCENPKTTGYKYWGGRGISMCKRWRSSFIDFLYDMGECPDGWSIERINVNGNYKPANCCWIPREHQNRNKRNSLKNRRNREPTTEENR